MRVRGYHLPAINEQIATERRAFGDVEVELPRLRPEQVRAVMTHARCAADRLRQRPVDDVLAVLDRAVSNWLRPEYPPRQIAEQALASATGFSTAMIRHGLPLLLAPLRGDAIGALLDAELGDRRVLDGVAVGRRAVGAALMTHVMSGNIPALAAPPLLLSLAIKSAALVKSAAGDLIFPALFAASIREIDEQMGECMLVTHWRGGDRAIEDVAFAEADLVVASGSDAAIAAIAAHAPARFVGYGHKISCAAIGRECLRDAEQARTLAQRLAYDVSLWDQQGCLSPQLCYLEGGAAVTPAEFAQLLAEALAHCVKELPCRALSFEEQAAVQRFRHEAEWASGSSAAATLLSSPDSTDWSVSIESAADFRPTCLNRCIRLKRIPALADLAAILAPHRRHLEAVGVAIGADRLGVIAELLATCGVHRVCPIGTMQLPPVTWRQSGRPRVADWVEWVGVET